MEYNLEKNPLRNVKIFRLLFVQFLIVGLFATSLVPQACFCGEACLHGLQGKTKARLSFLLHTRCSGTQCKSCNFEDGQTLQAKNASNATGNLDILNTPLIILFLSDYYPDNYTITIFYPRNDAFLKFQSSTIYILNLSLLI